MVLNFQLQKPPSAGEYTFDLQVNPLKF